ncbi:MAG: hypothetical protein JXA73_14865 [Acidobacteria bacterium]|nr:hypothetical protein [Acidobacteriota bacterium]
MKRRILLLVVIPWMVFSVCAQVQEMIRIASPKDGSEVSERPVVTVEIQDRNVNVWVVVHPLGTDRYWVQPSVRKTGDRRWQSTAYIGRPGAIDAGKMFEIVAVGNPKRELAEGDQLNSWPQSQWRSNVVRVRRTN